MIIRDPFLLLLVLLIPLLIYFYLRGKNRGSIKFSTLENAKGSPKSWALWARHGLIALRCLAIFLLVVALARPQSGKEETKVASEGIDIVMAIDVSGSMLAEDFQVNGRRRNRLFVVKDVVNDFIAKRPNDRIGIVVFAGRPYTHSPLTLDHGWLLGNLDRIEIGMLEDGTAVGSALATALNRLRESEAKSKIVVLLTDGINNAGKVEPETAAEAAKALGIKVYTIGAGTKGEVPYPTTNMFGRKVYRLVRIEIDEDSLRGVAGKTGGKYFRATDTNSLRQVYEEIDRLEKTEIETLRYLDYRDLYPQLLIVALILILIELILANTRLRTVP